MTTSDPYSLDRMADIVVPDPVSWWPPATGWYFVGAALALWCGVLSARLIRHYRANAYRRQAIQEIQAISKGDFATLSILLKRVAMVTFPREQVASLVGDAWVDFLSQTCNQSSFDRYLRQRIVTASSVPESGSCDTQTWNESLVQCKSWIIHHAVGRSE